MKLIRDAIADAERGIKKAQKMDEAHLAKMLSTVKEDEPTELGEPIGHLAAGRVAYILKKDFGLRLRSADSYRLLWTEPISKPFVRAEPFTKPGPRRAAPTEREP